MSQHPSTEQLKALERTIWKELPDETHFDWLHAELKNYYLDYKKHDTIKSELSNLKEKRDTYTKQSEILFLSTKDDIMKQNNLDLEDARRNVAETQDVINQKIENLRLPVHTV